MDRKLETLIAALKLIEQHGDSAYAYAKQREAKRPERVVGLHFFNPVERMPLVEIIYG